MTNPNLPDLPGLPRDQGEPVFRAPWQAQAFAMTVALYQQGLFTWPEWAQALAQTIEARPAQPAEDAGDAYYRQWLETLERIVAAKGASSPAELQRYRQAWDHAADRTPHGQPIELQASDFSPWPCGAAGTGPRAPSAPPRRRGSG